MSLRGKRGDDVEDVSYEDGLLVNSIRELIGGSGVTIDNMLVKDGGVTATGGILCDAVSEVTTGQGVTIDLCLFKDGAGTFASVLTDDLTEKTTSAGITCNSNLTVVNGKTLSTDTITEATSGSGVTIENVLLKDGAVTGVVSHSYYAGMSVTGQSLSNNTVTAMALDTDLFDPGSITNTSTGEITIPITGVYFVRASIAFPAGTGKRNAYIYSNGSQHAGTAFNFDVATSAATEIECTDLSTFFINDVITMRGYQNSGGSLSCDATLTLCLLTT